MTGPLAERIKEEATRGCLLLARELGRAPTQREINLMVMAIYRHHTEPDAPTTRLQ
jgi:hypothetical protein